MITRTQATLVVVGIACGLTGCDGRPSRSQFLAPSSVTTPAAQPTPSAPVLTVFAEAATGFSTSEVRDAQGQVVQFTRSGDLIWMADGTRFSGFPPAGGNYVQAESRCQCWLEVRFGSEGGERRAYLTADYGHDNPATLLDLEVVAGALVMTRSSVYPPGSFTVSGLVFENTPQGPSPLEGAGVSLGYGTGWLNTTTDANGLYRIEGVQYWTETFVVGKEGFQKFEREISIKGDTRLDIELVRQ